MRACVCVRMCVCVRLCARVSMCKCYVCERASNEKKRAGGGGGGRGAGSLGGDRDYVCLHVCMYVTLL